MTRLRAKVAQAEDFIPTGKSKYYGLAVGLIYGVAVILRIVRYLSAGLSSENGLIGSTAEEFLRGNFPLFLLGKNHMGIYDACSVCR